MHGEVSRKMWKDFEKICEIKAVTNAQNHTYWKDKELEKAFEKEDYAAQIKRKKVLKSQLFDVVADQTGKRFREDVLTIVWARRFAGYKRANLLLSDFDRFLKIVYNPDFPVQIIWAGKPYPEDQSSISIFNDIHWKVKPLANCTILTGYELKLSALLKRGSDVWLNNPRLYREASGTSGMTAAMNGSINFSIPDGWVPEFAVHGKNCFSILPADRLLSVEEQDKIEADRLYDILENQIIPRYYKDPESWSKMMRQGWQDVVAHFDSNRMAHEYYDKMY